jgi:phosphoserine phosphatase
MKSVTVLLIANDAEVTVICAALAKCLGVRVMEARDVGHAIKLLGAQAAAPAVAISTSASLTKSARELVETLHARGIPFVVIAAGLSQKARQRALAAGIKEIHDRPKDWHAYSKLIEAVIRRFAGASAT